MLFRSGAALTFFGMIHADSVGICMLPGAVFAYLFVGAMIFVMFRFGRNEGDVLPDHEP